MSQDSNIPRTGLPSRGSARVLILICIAFILALGPLGTNDAQAGVAVRIQLSQQTMNVAVDGTDFATWPVSTARPGYRTPIGIYRPYLLERSHYSKLYNNSPMPFSMFFLRGYAIHGTNEIRDLGRAVSHGCVRLSPDHARKLFELTRSYGLQNTTIEIIE